MPDAPLTRVVVEIAGSPFHALVTPEDGVVRAAGFTTPDDPEAAELWARLARLDPPTAARGIAAHPAEAGAVAAALRAYQRGDLAALDGLPVRQRESPFRGEVWRALRTVPAGSVVSYTALADSAGRPTAVRAAASACANNLIALIVPCHRVVRGDGALGGYLYGVDVKQRLLEHEGARQARQ